MIGALRHAADLALYRATRSAHEREDAAALRGARGRRRRSAWRRAWRLEWLGVAGYRITYEGRSLLLDPYFSRVPFRNVWCAAPALPDPR